MTHVLSCLQLGENIHSAAPVVSFSVVRNERALLPQFLAHYRKLGVESFVFVDNQSTDGTTEFLRAQPDVTLYWTPDRYSQSNCGTEWVNTLISLHGQDRWCLSVDADELLTFRDSEEQPASEFLKEVEQRGARAVFAYMLDLYPDGPLCRAVLSEDTDFFQVCNAHDRDYVFRVRPTKPWRTLGFPPFEVLGGPRLRLWSSLEKEARTTWVNYFLRGQLDRVERWIPKRVRPRLVSLFENQPPHLEKVPIVKPASGSGFRFYMGAHACSRLPLHHENAVLCHFKFTASFIEKAKREVERGEHYRGGSQYQRYLQLLTQGESSNICYEGTVRYAGTKNLCDLGLIRTLTTREHSSSVGRQTRNIASATLLDTA